MSSAEQQGISVRRRRPQSLSRGGSRDGRRDRQHRRRKRRLRRRQPPERVEAIIIDCSTSMQSPIEKFDAAKRATAAAIDELVDGTYFTIVAGTEKAASVYPADGQAGAGERGDQGRGDARRRRPATQRRHRDGHLARARPRNRRAAPRGAHPRDPAHRRQGRARDPRTTAARRSASAKANSPATAGESAPTGSVEELRAISSALLGTVDIVADPADLADDFAAMMRASMSKSIPDLTLRLWTPAGARVEFVKQVAPTVEDLTHRRVDAGNQFGEYPLGSWGAEDRDYHIQVEVEPAAVGREKLAARVSVVAGDQVLGEGLVKAVWTADTALSARISRRVAHYTGQAELAQAVQEGLSARKSGDVATATAKLQRAMELAVESGNDGTAKLLRGVVEVDERTGTVRLRRDVAAADEMALDARSTRTARVRKEET